MTEPSLPFGSSRPTRRTLLGTAGAVGAAAVVGAATPAHAAPPAAAPGPDLAPAHEALRRLLPDHADQFRLRALPGATARRTASGSPAPPGGSSSPPPHRAPP